MATIKDVAKLAGVSTSTASRAMHDSDMISEATKERVRKAMEQLDYSPNFSAQNLVNRTANTIGIVLPVRESQSSLGDNPFFMQIIQGISSVCNEHEYMVSLATGRTDDGLQKNIQSLIRSGNISKFIFLYSKKGDPVFQFVKKQKKIDCVVVGASYEETPKPNIHFVDNNNYQAGKDVTDFMVAKGYKNLAFAYTNMDELVQSERYNGYSVALSEQGLSGTILNLSRTDEAGNAQTLENFLDQHPDLQGFVACDDIMAIRLQRLFKAINVSSQTYGMIGFNNSIITEVASPSLSSVDIFPYRLGENAAELLLQNQSEPTDETTVIPHQIIERDSTPSLA